MEILSQRGDNEFLIKAKGKYHFFTLADNKIITKEEPESFFRMGYWKDVTATEATQKSVITLLEKQI